MFRLHRWHLWKRAWPLLLLAVAGGVATALLSPAPAAEVPDPPPPAAAKPAEEQAVVDSSTRLRYETTYRPCDQTLVDEVAAPPALRGMGRADLERAYPQWEIKAWEPGIVVLARVTDELCPEYQNWRHVRLEAGEVVVYYGRRGSQLLKERTGITADMLPPAEQMRLARGVDLAGDAAVAAFLEGDH